MAFSHQSRVMKGHYAFLHWLSNRVISLLPLPFAVQVDNHFGELTVRETLEFSARCQTAGFQKGSSACADG